MANDSDSQQALAADPSFLRRLENALTKVAWQVLLEAPSTEGHTSRVNLARTVLGNPLGFASTLAPSFVNRTNVFAFVTSYDFRARATVTASGDPDIESQLSTDWSTMAGV